VPSRLLSFATPFPRSGTFPGPGFLLVFSLFGRIIQSTHLFIDGIRFLFPLDLHHPPVPFLFFPSLNFPLPVAVKFFGMSPVFFFLFFFFCGPPCWHWYPSYACLDFFFFAPRGRPLSRVGFDGVPSFFKDDIF